MKECQFNKTYTMRLLVILDYIVDDVMGRVMAPHHGCTTLVMFAWLLDYSTTTVICLFIRGYTKSNQHPVLRGGKDDIMMGPFILDLFRFYNNEATESLCRRYQPKIMKMARFFVIIIQSTSLFLIKSNEFIVFLFVFGNQIQMAYAFLVSHYSNPQFNLLW